MNPQPLFCTNPACPSRGQIGAGNLRIHDSQRSRWKCRVCKKTFSARKGTPFYGLKHDPQLLVWVVTLLALGCPTQAIVTTFELDERTAADWQARAGVHCQAVHEAIVQTPQELQHVQADFMPCPLSTPSGTVAGDGNLRAYPAVAGSRDFSASRQTPRPPHSR